MAGAAKDVSGAVDTPIDTESEPALIDVLAEIAATHGDDVAFADRHGGRYSYAEWLRDAEAATELLVSRTAPGARVLVHLPRAADREFGPLLVAALSTRRWVVPILRPCSETQLRRIRDETQASALISEGDGAGLDLRPLPGAPAERPRADAGGCIVYTSGSTGHPRGVMCPAEDMRRWLRSRRLPLPRGGQLTQFRLDTISGLYGLSAAMLSFPVARVSPLDVAGLERVLDEHRLVHVALMPTGIQAMQRRGLHLTTAAAEAMRLVVVTGSRTSRRELEFVRAHFPRARIKDVYTSTEAGLAMVAKWYAPDRPLPALDDGPGWPVGRPIPGAELQVVDDDGRRLPDGDEGWVWLRDSTPSRRYVTHYDTEAGTLRPGGWVATGDRGIVAGGELYLRGRGTETVLVEGRPVACALVEQTLVSHPDVAAAAVVGTSDEGVAAFVVLSAPDGMANGRELRALVRDRLGPESTPQRVELVSQLPVTEAGKVDRAALTRRAGEAAVR